MNQDRRFPRYSQHSCGEQDEDEELEKHLQKFRKLDLDEKAESLRNKQLENDNLELRNEKLRKETSHLDKLNSEELSQKRKKHLHQQKLWEQEVIEQKSLTEHQRKMRAKEVEMKAVKIKNEQMKAQAIEMVTNTAMITLRQKYKESVRYEELMGAEMELTRERANRSWWEHSAAALSGADRNERKKLEYYAKNRPTQTLPSLPNDIRGAIGWLENDSGDSNNGLIIEDYE